MSPPPSERVRGEWRRRIEAEYRSAAMTAELGFWLIRIGASPDLIEDALAITGDELEHARLSYRVYEAAGGQRAPDIDEAALALARGDGPLFADVTRAAAAVYCLGETVAVPLFAHLRSRCSLDPARAALDRIVADEVRHRDFGWDLLGHLIDRDPSAQKLVIAGLPGWLAELEAAYGGSRAARLAAAGAAGIDDSDRAWGLAPASEYAAILERAVGRDLEPRFADLGIDAAEAWASRACTDRAELL